MKKAERRASIVAVAKVLFADRGFHGVSVDEIARKVGVSPAVLYQHFPSKEALYEGVLDTLAAPRETYIEAALDGPDDFASVLRRITAVFVERIQTDPDYLRMELLAALEGGQIAQRFFESRWQAIADYIEYTLHELASEKRIPSLNERSAALMFQGLIREVLYAKCVLDSERHRTSSLAKLVEQAIEFFLRAVGYM